MENYLQEWPGLVELEIFWGVIEVRSHLTTPALTKKKLKIFDLQNGKNICFENFFFFSIIL